MRREIRLYFLLPFILLCSCGRDITENKNNAVNVVVSKPEQKIFKNILKVKANVEPKYYAAICARVAGCIDFVKVDEGDKIKKNELLFQIDKENLQNNLDIANSMLKVSESMLQTKVADYKIELLNFKKKEINYQRALRLAKQGQRIISEDEYEEADLAYKTAITSIKKAKDTLGYSEAIIERLKSEKKVAEKKLEDSEVKAPYDGVVTEVIKKAGEYVKEGGEVLKMENPDISELSAYISSRYYSKIITGKTMVEIYTNDGEKIITMPITYKSPNIDSESRTFEVKIILENNEKLVNGMLCEMKIVLAEEKCVGVSEDAVIMRSGNKTVIFSVDKGIAREIEVKTGITYDGYTEIKNKIPDNIDVVVEGQAFLNNGVAVKVMNNSEKDPENVSK